MDATMKKTALITGISGQTGSYLAEHLLEQGYDVHGIIRRSSLIKTDRIDHIFDKITLHYGDLTDKAKKKARSQRKMAIGGVVRDYASEYANYHSSAEQKQNRASRNAARRIAKNNGQNVTGKDVAHKNGNPKDNRVGNLTTKTASQNRSYPRTKTAGKRNPYA